MLCAFPPGRRAGRQGGCASEARGSRSPRPRGRRAASGACQVPSSDFVRPPCVTQRPRARAMWQSAGRFPARLRPCGAGDRRVHGPEAGSWGSAQSRQHPCPLPEGSEADQRRGPFLLPLWLFSAVRRCHGDARPSRGRLVSFPACLQAAAAEAAVEAAVEAAAEAAVEAACCTPASKSSWWLPEPLAFSRSVVPVAAQRWQPLHLPPPIRRFCTVQEAPLGALFRTQYFALTSFKIPQFLELNLFLLKIPGAVSVSCTEG